MANKPAVSPRRPAAAALPADAEAQAPGGSQFLAVRETIESIVVAFALAFLIRTFEAEAFVIPTGSMSPSLLGMHKDVTCSECGTRFRVTASDEDPEEAARRGADPKRRETIGGVCPNCRYLMPLRPDLPPSAIDALGVDSDSVEHWRTYPGDRILVNKFGSDFQDPSRWDVVVFKFPGDGNMNYIKRLVGLPGEELRIQYGDLFRRALDKPGDGFPIERKPAEKVAAMLQPVHDTDHDPATLYNAGFPLRWAATTPDGWQVEAKPGDQLVAQTFTVDTKPGTPTAWLRYRHQLPEWVDWWIAHALAQDKAWKEIAGTAPFGSKEEWLAHVRPELIADFNPYNARVARDEVAAGLDWDVFHDNRSMGWVRLGGNWVGDLAVDCTVEDAEPRGDLILDLVEAGVHFRATINLATGRATLSAIDGRTGETLPFKAEADTSVKGGSHELRLANVDDQLLLWVDGKLVKFDDSTYDADKIFPGGRQKAIPWAGAEGEDQGDLSPAGIGAAGAKLTVTRLAVLRDIYYTATSSQYSQEQAPIYYDYDGPMRPAELPGGGVAAPLAHPRDLFANPEAWPRFFTRRGVDFKVKPNQLFVMGDNSPESADARIWAQGNLMRGFPGGPYLDRELLIGKAICVFWPHSWGAIPGLPKIPGLPNFKDMRIVR